MLRCALGFTLPLLFGALLGGLLLLSLALILARLLSLLLLVLLLPLPLFGATGFLCGLSLGSLVLIWLCLIFLGAFLATFLASFPAATPLRACNVGGAD